MQVKVQSVKNGKIASVHPKVAKVMVAKGTVRYVEDAPPVAKEVVVPVTKVIVPEVPEPIAEVTPDEEPTDAQDDEVEGVEISPRTGLPKRQYNRRDMKAQD